MTLVKDKIWAQTLESLSKKIDASAYETWFAPTSAIWEDDKHLTIRVPSRFFQEWISSHYLLEIKDAMEEQGLNDVSFKIEVDEAARKRLEEEMKLRQQQYQASASLLAPQSKKQADYQPSQEILLGTPAESTLYLCRFYYRQQQSLCLCRIAGRG